MNKDRINELLPIIQAFAEGKCIQIKSFNGIGWVDAPDLVFGGEPKDYRIKPKPIEIWCTVNSKGHCLSNQRTESDCIELIEKLNRENKNDFIDYKVVKFREVIDDESI